MNSVGSTASHRADLSRKVLVNPSRLNGCFSAAFRLQSTAPCRLAQPRGTAPAVP